MAIVSGVVAEPKLELPHSGPVFKMPNPGDVFMLTTFGWAALCFFMVTIGNRLFFQLARLSASREIREILVDNQSAVAGIMVLGLIGIAFIYFLFFRYPKFLLGGLLAGLAFSAARWGPVHDLAFVIRYMAIIFFGVYGAIFGLQNFWRIFTTPYFRLIFCLFILDRGGCFSQSFSN